MKHRSANMKQKPYGFYEAARCAVKRSAVLLLREPNSQSEFSALLHRAKPCFIFHAPQVRFISKQKSTALAVLFCLARVDKKDANYNFINLENSSATLDENCTSHTLFPLLK